MTTTTTTVRVGTKFRYRVADGNPLFRVTRKVRPGVWDAVCVNEPFTLDGDTYPSDGAGNVRRFTEESIAGVLRYQAVFAGISQAQDDWWAGQPLGKTLHYHHCFGAYVRGVVVEHKGERCLKPEALVGAWSEWDLPRRGPTGEVGYSSGGRFFEAGHEPWQPSITCVFEHPDFRGQGDDPRRMGPIDLTVSGPTPEQAKEERLHLLRAQVLSALSSGDDVEAQLEAAFGLLVA